MITVERSATTSSAIRQKKATSLQGHLASPGLEVQAVIWLAITSAAIRLIFCLKGGQFYWWDETRYCRALELLHALLRLNLHNIKEVLAYPDHFMFTLTALPAALIQVATGHIDHIPESNLFWLGAFVLSLSSVISQPVVYAIARKLGAGKVESVLAVVLMASSNALFYYSRHLFPYDTALMFGLAAILVGFGNKTKSTSLLVGALAGCCFWTYSGYWSLAAAVILSYSFARTSSISKYENIVKALFSGLGAGLVTAVVLGIGSFATGLHSFLLVLNEFSQTPHLGEFAEGWSHPWEYFFNAEGALALLWLCGFLFCAVFAVVRSQDRRARWCASFPLALYSLLVLGSSVLHKSVLYGRIDREMAPFLCLAAAFAVCKVAQLSRAAWLPFLIAALAIINGSFNFSKSYSLVFPADIVAKVERSYGPVRQVSTMVMVHSNLTSRKSRMVLVDAVHVEALIDETPMPAGRVIFSVPHPIQYLPFQYEFFTPAERERLRQSPPRMVLIDAQKD